LCRAAHWGEQSLGLGIWPGDMDSTFTKHGEPLPGSAGDGATAPAGVGGLPATIAMGLSLGVSGFPFFGADTGGYRHGPPDAELYVRWFEQTALSSVMQVGDGTSQPPWVFTPENGRTDATVDLYRTYARLHMRLFPYEWTLATRIATDGRPIQRPLGLAYPALGVHPSDEYLFGDDLLVAPVVTRGERRRRLVVPRGTWLDFWDGAPVTGSGPDASAEIDAPLERLPLLLREGAIVPMLRPTIDTLSPATDPDVDSFARDPGALWVLVVPGPARSFTLWDGTSIARTNDGAIAVASGAVFAEGFVLELIATPEPTEVALDGGPVLARADDLDAVAEGFTWLPDRRGTLRVKLPAGASRVLVR
jgi:alpha-D-xyloside xylohydrolase